MVSHMDFPTGLTALGRGRSAYGGIGRIRRSRKRPARGDGRAKDGATKPSSDREGSRGNRTVQVMTAETGMYCALIVAFAVFQSDVSSGRVNSSPSKTIGANPFLRS